MLFYSASVSTPPQFTFFITEIAKLVSTVRRVYWYNLFLAQLDLAAKSDTHT